MQQKRLKPFKRNHLRSQSGNIKNAKRAMQSTKRGKQTSLSHTLSLILIQTRNSEHNLGNITQNVLINRNTFAIDVNIILQNKIKSHK